MPDALPVEALRWRCDPESLTFESTDDVEPVHGVIGQESAVEAVRFGLACTAPGQNVFIAGLTGTGRMTLVAHLLDELKPECAIKWDRCYVRNFGDPFRPRLLSVPAGSARELRRRVVDVASFVKDGLAQAVNSDLVRARRSAISQQESAEIEEFTKPFENSLAEAGIALVSITTGPVTRPMLLPLVEGKPTPFEEFEKLHEDGKLPDGEYDGMVKRLESFEREFESVSARVTAIRKKYAAETRALVENTVREMLNVMVKPILADFPGEGVATFLEELVDDVVEKRLDDEPGEDPDEVYGVHIVIDHDEGESCPIVVENTPTLVNLLGTVDRSWGPSGPTLGGHNGIRGGSLLRADGGYLILDARDVLGEPGAWKVLVRTLRCGELEIVPSEVGAMFGPMLMKPEPIPVRVRVLLVGDREIYYLLDHHDPDFGDLFKVLAEFDDTIERDCEGTHQYARVLARLARKESLPAFDRSAVAELAAHGARIAARKGKMTARFGRVADIAREAAFLATERDAEPRRVTGEDVQHAVRRTKHRAGLSSRRFQELVAEGTLLIETSGSVVGQINGLAVMTAGPLTYGFPARITASVGVGRAGIVDIEGQSALSGSIHTKGFHILGGLLRHLMQTEHPLALSASLAFEQSYGGIDGDSASAAETVCFLSALTGVPIRQGIAMTGSIDQLGSIQPIGGANEKIEGFYDACVHAGLTGDQGVAIPSTNVGDLMLRPDVVAACERGEFHVYPMATIHDAIEIATGTSAGRRDEDGLYPEESVLGQAVVRARNFWLKTSRGSPADDDDDPA